MMGVCIDVHLCVPHIVEPGDQFVHDGKVGFIPVNQDELTAFEGLAAQQGDEGGQSKGIAASADTDDFCGGAHVRSLIR
jgi:hypothetical protein